MIKSNKLKIFNDPIYGFIRIPNALIYNLIEHKYFQRLRRISQMGMSFLVYPGAHHTRFQHALGSMHLMEKAIQVLRLKDIKITEEEENGLLIAILLHDIGHGSFSHALEHSLSSSISHEEISLLFMENLNKEFDGNLTTAIKIFKRTHKKKFLNQLVSSQLDMDRLDYLKRDSFYTGVAEGNINSERLLTMLNVANDELVIEEKGIYSVEKFLTARRFMYWQVYLHKTSLVAEQLLCKLLLRARVLTQQGMKLGCSDPLNYFLKNEITKPNFNDSVLDLFAQLDDVDVMAAIKMWQNHPDFVLSNLSKILLNRKLLKLKIKNKPIDDDKFNKRFNSFKEKHALTDEESSYFIFRGEVANQAYNQEEQNINILKSNKKLVDVAKASDHFNLKALSKKVTKFYVCYPKETV